MLIALIIGIGAYNWIGIRSAMIPSILIVLLGIYYIILNRGLGFQNRIWYGVLIQLMTILLGYTMASYQDGLKDTNHFSNYADQEHTAIFGLVTEVKERTNRYEAVVTVSQVMNNDSLVSVSGNLNAYIPYKNIDTTLSIGQHIGLQAIITEHPAPRNPEVFDYGNYLSKKHIYHQTADVAQITVISECTSPKFWMSKHRERILKSFHNHIDNQSNYAIAASIILGYRDAVDYETKKAFAETGSIHILAVSGMHVGIIFLVLGLLINKINNHRRRYRLLKFTLFLIGIWGFVLLAGMPPSALRAAWLFTLILVGGFVSGKSNLYHRLCIAAFMMLVWNANYLFDVGFQLSFSAILGIAAFGGIWEKLFTPKNKLSQYLWDGTGMTIGATLGTLPLTMYYFHYFPITALVSSVVVIFFATIILQLGVSFLLCFWLSLLIPWFEQGMAFIGSILNFVVGGLQSIVHFFHSLPYGFISGISLSILAVVLFYTLFVSVRMVLNNSKKKVFIYAGVLSVLGLSGLSFINHLENSSTSQLVVYHDYQHNAIELFDNGSSVLISKEPLDERYAGFLNNGLRINKQVSSSRAILATGNIIGSRFVYDDGALKFGKKELLKVKGPGDLKGKERIHWDYIYLVDNVDLSIAELFDQLNFDQIIIGASNWQRKVDHWVKECDLLEIPYIDIKNTQALVIDV